MPGPDTITPPSSPATSGCLMRPSSSTSAAMTTTPQIPSIRRDYRHVTSWGADYAGRSVGVVCHAFLGRDDRDKLARGLRIAIDRTHRRPGN
jgi:hypothetical protein